MFIIDTLNMTTKRLTSRKVKEKKSKQQAEDFKGRDKPKSSKLTNGRIMTRCSSGFLYKLCSEKGLAELMSPQAHALLKQTGFYHFLNIPKVRFSGVMFGALMQVWDTNINGIRVENKVLRMTANDLSVILGINCYGTTVCLNDHRPSTTLREWSKKGNVFEVDRDY